MRGLSAWGLHIDSHIRMLSEVLRAGRASTAGLSPLSTPDSILMCDLELDIIRGKCSVRERVTKSPSVARHNYILKNNMFCCM